MEYIDIPIDMLDMKVDRDLMFRFFQNENTEEEAEMLGRWLKESGENENEFRKAYDVFLVSQMFLSSKDVEKARRDAERYMQRKKRILRTAGMAAGIAASLVCGFFISDRFFTRPIRELVGHSTLAFSNSPGQITTLTLSDGTTVHLNADSRIEYPAVFFGDERRVSLDGEAIFDVSHNEDMPFVVETFRYDIEVLGTRFDVIADEDGGRFSAALMEGSISLLDRNTGQGYRMSPDQIAVLSDDGLEISGLESTDSYLWTDGIISAAGMPFDRLMEEFEKYYNIKIVIRRDTLPEIGYGRLRIRISDGISKAMELLSKTTDFNWIYDSAGNVIYID